MKKYKVVELLILLVISIPVAVILPNYFHGRDTIRISSVSEFMTWFLVVFIVLAVLYFSIKPKEKLASIPDGHQKLYNEKNQITKEGVFKGGRLINGLRHVYHKNGTLSHTEIYKNGVYIEDDRLLKDR
jgi:hypothetical protein